MASSDREPEVDDVARLRHRPGPRPRKHTVNADDSPDHAIDYMRRYGLRRLPVVDGQRLIGTVWIADLVITNHDREHPDEVCTRT